MPGIYIWGTGCGAGELVSMLPHVPIAGYVDSFPLGETFMGAPVIKPEALKELSPELVMVSARQSAEILAKCMELGISRDRLFFVKNSVRLENMNRDCAAAEKRTP